MDEFDFDAADSDESSSRLGRAKPASPSRKKIPPSPSSSLSSFKGRTKSRKPRKVVLSGAQAIKEGQQKRREAEEKEKAVADAKTASLLKKKKRAAASTPSSNERIQSSSPEKSTITTKGRRHKHRKTERKQIIAGVDRNVGDDFSFGQNSVDSKSVRFAESAAGKERNNTHEPAKDSQLGPCESSSSSTSTSSVTEKKSQPSSCLRTKPIYPPTSTHSTKSKKSSDTPPTSPATNSSVSYSSFSKIHGNGARKKRHKPRRFQLGCSPSGYSSSSSTSSKSPQKTQVVSLGRSFGYSSRDFESTPDAAEVAQNMGNYRMLIDELSYLCSAILHCKQQHRIGFAKTEVICKHNSITAGAACDIGELMSRSDSRIPLLMSSSNLQQRKSNNGGKNVGALGAILEAIACAPSVIDWVDICRGIIIGTEMNDFKLAELSGDSNAAEFVLDNNNLAAVPLSSLAERTKFDSIASKALSVVSLFVGIDCTGSSRAAITPSNKAERSLVKGARNNILQHQQSLRGIARLISDDPVVNSYLRSKITVQKCSPIDGGNESTGNADEISIGSKSSRASTLSSISMSKASSQQTVDEQSQSRTINIDPTKAGRQRGRKRKKLLAIREVDSEKDSEYDLSSTACSKLSDGSESKSPDKSGKSNCLDFHSEDSSAKLKPDAFVKKVRLKSVEKYTEKLALALSRAKMPQLDAAEENTLGNEDDTNLMMCSHCQIWGKDVLQPHSCLGANSVTSSSLAIAAAENIITGKDTTSGEDDAEDGGVGDEDDDSVDDDFLSDGTQVSGDESSKNPILYANEMLRKSGSLPDFSRAYSSTLSAILVAYKSNHSERSDGVPSPQCHRCIAYLQKRASSLSGIIDNLCCLSPKASRSLSCPESYLVSGLLKVIMDLSFGGKFDIPFVSTGDAILSSLKTLTSLTHENSVACEQLVRPYNWDNVLPISLENTMSSTDQTTTGVGIIFSYLMQLVSKKHDKTFASHGNGCDNLSDKYSYDAIIFCLNILTNVVEMAPHSAKHMMECITVSYNNTNAITWLTRWVVSITSGFQKSIMKGSFGSEADKQESTCDSDELKAGEEGNLVTAGNGFVLIAYLMLDDESTSTAPSSIRDSVIQELPVDNAGTSGGIQYMIKTLKAFCNFYHFSVGDLSVAVIAPIVKLISGLEKLDVVEQRKAWL